MHIIEMIFEWAPAVIGLVILIGGAVTVMTRSRMSAKEWLVFAVTEAEKALGSGTGACCLRRREIRGGASCGNGLCADPHGAHG